MHLTARLTSSELERFVQAAIPFEFSFGNAPEGEKTLVIDRFLSLTFVPEQGIRLGFSGHVSWPVLGVNVPLRFSSLTCFATIRRELRPHASLVWGIVLETVDVAWTPDVIDRTLARKVNEALLERNFELVWDFENLVTHQFSLPPALRSLRTISLGVTGSRLCVGAENVLLELDLRAESSSTPPPSQD